MAAPTAPTASSIVQEGISKAGYRAGTTRYGQILTQATAQWMEEIKYDIWERSKQLRSLMTTSRQLLTEGRSLYSFPSDYSSMLNAKLWRGKDTGTAQTGTTTSITLAANSSFSSSNIVGRNIAITSGTGSGESSQITAYDSTTKVVTIAPAITSTPDSTSVYLIVDQEFPLQQHPIWFHDEITQPNITGTPISIYTVGDADTGEYILSPVPDGVYTYVLQIRYYQDLTLLDLASSLMSVLYRKYRSVFIQGIYAKALQEMNDDRASQEIQVYTVRLRNLVGREEYGSDVKTMTRRIARRYV